MPVCIAGMARSGTSLCTHMLNLCGLYLGEEADLLPPGPENPDGYWENTRFIEINETLLSMFGGAWDCPPIIPLEDNSEPFARLHAKAETTLASFASHEPWGWKDPRNSLTLPFWRQYFPEMKVVICLRNPLEVAQSLYRRSWYTTELSLTLWYIYNQRIRNAIPPEQCIVTHYDAYFADPEAEIRRVLDFLGMSAGDKRIAQACAVQAGGLRHHHFTTQQLYDVHVSTAVLDLYMAMCREAGDVALVPPHVANERPKTSATPRPAQGMENDSSPEGEQLGLAVESVGRLDRAAFDVIMLRDEVRDLQAVVSTAQAVIGTANEEQRLLRARSEALEQQLMTLGGEYERRGAYVDALEQQRVADTAVDAELRAYVRDLEGSLTAVHTDHRALHQYAQTLEEHLQATAEEREQLRAYAHALEEQCGIAEAEQYASADHMRTLEAILATVQQDSEQRGAYAATLEHQLSAALADHQQLADYARSLEQSLATMHDDHMKLDAWAKTLIERIEILEAAGQDGATYIAEIERQLVAVRAHPRRAATLGPASTPSRRERFAALRTALVRRFDRMKT